MAEDQEAGALAEAMKPLLSFASLLYGTGVTLLQKGYAWGLLPRKRLPFPVISVGNVTWGGTGKTPLVEYLARRVVTASFRCVPRWARTAAVSCGNC